MTKLQIIRWKFGLKILVKRDWVFGAYRHVQRMVREPRWKLIKYNVKGVKTKQLFDLERDPWEINNLADDPASAATVSRLETLLKRVLKEADDPVDFEADHPGK